MTFKPFVVQAPASSPFGAPAPQPVQGFGQAPQPAFGGGMFSGFGTAEAGGDRQPPLPQGGHERVRIGPVEIAPSTKPGQTHIIYFRAELTNVQTNVTGNFTEQLTGHQFGRDDSLARIRGLINAAHGMDDKDPTVRAKWADEREAEKLLLDARDGGITGKEISVPNVRHKITKSNKLIGLYTFARLGSPVQGVGPVLPMPAAAPMFPPAGWTASAQYPGHFTGNYQGKTVTVTENDLKSAIAAGSI